MEKKRRLIATIILALFLSYLLTSLVLAAESIADTDTTGIYSGEMFGSSSFLKSILHKLSEVMPVFAGFDVAGKTIGTLLVHLADLFYLGFAASGLSLSSIIYGRVGGALEGADNLNLFSFEMASGNFYGIAAMSFFSIIRSSFMVIMMMILMWDLVSFIYTNGDSRQRTRLTDRLKTFVVIMLAMILLPRALDVLLYMRDSLLYTILVSSSQITEAFSDALGGAGKDTSSIIDTLVSGPTALFMRFVVPGGAADICYTFRMQAVSLELGTTFGNCLCYFASVFALFLFMAQYIGMALSMCVLVVFFPFACAMNLIYPNILKEWGKNLIGLVMVPLIDAILFTFPVLAAVANDSGKYNMIAFVQLALIYGIIPARGTVRGLLGLGRGTAIEMSGLGAMMGVMNLVKTAAAIGVSVVTAGAGAAAVGTAGAAGASGAAGAAGGAGAGKAASSSAASMFLGKAKHLDFSSQAQGTSALDEMERAVDGIPGSADDLKKRRRQMDDIGRSTGTSSRKFRERRGVVEDAIRDIDRRKEDLSADLSENDRRVQRAKKDLSASKDRQASYEAQLAKLQVPKGSLDTPEKEAQNEHDKYDLRQKIASEKMNQTRLNKEISDGNARAAQGKTQMEQFNTAQRYGKQAIAGMKASAGNISDDSDILDKYADINNFETPDFRGISYERRAELIEERESAMRRSVIGKVVGAGAGGLVAGAGSMFYGPGASAYMASVGMDYGGRIGESVAYSYGGSGGATMYENGSAHPVSGAGPVPVPPVDAGPSPSGGSQGTALTASEQKTGYRAEVSASGLGMPATGTNYSEAQAPVSYQNIGGTFKTEQDISHEISTRITQEAGKLQHEDKFDPVEIMGSDGVTGVTYIPRNENRYEYLYTESPEGNSGVAVVQRRQGVTKVEVDSGSDLVVYEDNSRTGLTVEEGTSNAGQDYAGAAPEVRHRTAESDWQKAQQNLYGDINRDFAAVFSNERTQEILWGYSQQAIGNAAMAAQEYAAEEGASIIETEARNRVVMRAVDNYTESLEGNVERLLSSRYVSEERRLAFHNYMKAFVIHSGLASKVEDDLISKRIIEDDGKRIFK